MGAWLASLATLLGFVLSLVVSAPVELRGSQLAAPLHAPAPATPASPTSSASVAVDWSRSAAGIEASVQGGTLARSWRVEIAGTGEQAGRRLVVTVTTSDVSYESALEIYDGQTLVDAIDPSTATEPYVDAGLGLVVDPASIVPPAGDSTLRLSVITSGERTYLLTGSVREVHEQAFQFGPWLSAAPITI